MSPAVLLSSFCAVAIAAALLFNLAVQQGRLDGWLALFSLSLLLWGLVAENSAPLSASLMTLTVLGYFLLIKQHAQDRLTRLLTPAAPVALVINLLLIWSDQAAVSVVVYLLLTLYAAAALWSILIARDPLAPRMRGAALLMLVACVVPLPFPDWLVSGALLLATAAAGWNGWVILRARRDQPIQALREEIRVANTDLHQAVGEIASLSAQNESLTQEIQAAGHVRNDFLDKLGHKLRTPLNSISGYTELMRSGLYGELNQTQEDRLGKIQRNSDNLLDLITDMIDLNQINVGRLKLNRTLLPLNPVIELVTSAVEPRREGVTLRCDLDAELPPVYGDEARVCQIITQMVENALQFTLEGEISIVTRSFQVEQGMSEQFPLPFTGWLSDGEWVVVEVHDTGIGIAPEDQAGIFEEFHQVVDARTDDAFGTGLGLSIAKRLAELHEGALWVKSAPEAGSSFYLALRALHK